MKLDDNISEEEFENTIKEGLQQGKDVSKYIYPKEWCYRERPEKHSCENIISLIDSIGFCGKKFFDTSWTGKEWYARSPEDIDKWDPVDNVAASYKRFICYLNTCKKEVDFYGQEKEEKEAYARKMLVYNKLLKWFNKGELKTFSLYDEPFSPTDHQFYKIEIAPYRWLQPLSFELFDKGVLIDGFIDGVHKGYDQGFIYLDKEELEKVINKEKNCNEISSSTNIAKKPNKKRGRHKGSGAINDDEHIKIMKDLLDNNKAKSVYNAAMQIIKGGQVEGTSDESKATRLRKKYRERYPS